MLDMGEPVKILSLAENMIRLSGHVPYDDIQIIFTGLRPGEKIFEELLMSEEGIATTAHKQIFVGKPIDFDMDAFLKKLEHLRSVADKENYDIRILIKEFVPTFKYEVIEDASETPIYTVSNKNKALAFV